MRIWLAPYSRWMEYKETKTGLNIIWHILIDIPAFYEAQKNLIFQRLIGYRLNYSLTSPLYDLRSIQCIEIYPWCICNMSWYFFCKLECAVQRCFWYFCFVIFLLRFFPFSISQQTWIKLTNGTIAPGVSGIAVLFLSRWRESGLK